MIPKFRIWDKKEKFMWVVAALRFYEEGNLFAIDYWGVQQYPETLDAEDVVLMQATGLQDKNGVDIYEGDILKGEQNIISSMHVPPFKSGVIKYSERNTMFYLDDGSKRHDLFISLGGDIYTYEVIGNIYENPNLLEEQS